MNINLPSEFNDFVKNVVVEGRFETAEAAIVEGLRLLMTREQLRQEIAKGIEQLDDGEWIDGDTVFREIHDHIDAIEVEKQQR
jgi:antitoxin ParD1/3/4